MRSADWLIVTVAVLAVVGSSWMLGTADTDHTTARAAAPAKTAPEADSGAKPVEDDMHEFMEYVFQPTYLRLKASMAAETKDNAVWKAIKSDSLILAEGGNLLLIRLPDEKQQAQIWKEHAVTVRDLGGSLYRAAKQKDDAAAGDHYFAMISRCNSCHDAFADGEHQLVP